jgi:hypothetical protein
MALETRWVSEMLYQMWNSGVSLVTWFMLRDEPFGESYWQSGLYNYGSDISSDTAKPVLRSFRFPFVAYPKIATGKTTVLLWGRTPTSKAGAVTIERKSGSKWVKVKTLSANGSGIFKASIPKPAKTTLLRARLSNGSDRSSEFSLIKPTKSWTGSVWGTF